MKKKQKILIVGSTGFLGYHLAKACLKNKYKVFSISRTSPKKNKKIKKVNYVYCDISKKKILEKKIKKIKNIDFLINLGGEVNHKNKKKVYLSHHVGVRNLSNCLLNKKLKKFIQIGSSMEYGHIKSPQSELSKCKPLSNYGNAKYLSTKYLLSLFKKKKFPAIILRLYQVYGPNQDINRLIPFVIENCKKNKKFPCSSGIQSRDFLYIDDFTKIIIKFLNSNKKTNGQIFNIGFGNPINLKKVIKIIQNKVGSGKPEFGKLVLRKEENLKTYPNINKMKKFLKWIPKINFNTGINKTIDSYLY